MLIVQSKNKDNTEGVIIYRRVKDMRGINIIGYCEILILFITVYYLKAEWNSLNLNIFQSLQQPLKLIKKINKKKMPEIKLIISTIKFTKMKLGKEVRRNKIVNSKWLLKPKHLNKHNKNNLQKISIYMLDNHSCVEKQAPFILFVRNKL